MKVCFLGNFRVPHTSENDYLWTMRERLGFEVAVLQESEATSAEVLDEALGADALLWVHTHGWETPGMRDVLATLKTAGIPTLAYHLDLYMGLDRWQTYEHHDYLRVEHFFTVDKLMADWLSANTNTEGHFIRPGVVERDCRLEDHELTHDVVFVGSYRYHHEWPYRPRLIDWLRETYPAFELWGPHGKGRVRGEELCDLYASTKITIGDTLCPGFDYPYYTSDRAYEVLGRGGFLIHPRIKGMEEELEDGKHLAYYDYGDFTGLRETIDHYLAHDSQRERIRAQGHAEVKENYTYTNRLEEIFGVIPDG